MGRKPDYDRIYALEREIYGAPFEHIGAPPPIRQFNFVSPGIGYVNVEAAVAMVRARNEDRAAAGFPVLPDAE